MSLNFPVFWYQSPSCSLGEEQGGHDLQNKLLLIQSSRISAWEIPVQSTSLRLAQWVHALCLPCVGWPMKTEHHSDFVEMKACGDMLHVNFQVARTCGQMNCKRSVYSGPLCPHLLQTSWSLTLCCFSWDVVPRLKQTWVKWLGSTYPWRCISR